jgi:hypothetical protein
MDLFAIRIEQITILALSVALLLSHWRMIKVKFRELRQIFKEYHPRK